MRMIKLSGDVVKEKPFIEIKPSNNNRVIVILNEEDLNDKNFVRLRGYTVHLLFLPRKYENPDNQSEIVKRNFNSILPAIISQGKIVYY